MKSNFQNPALKDVTEQQELDGSIPIAGKSNTPKATADSKPGKKNEGTAQQEANKTTPSVGKSSTSKVVTDGKSVKKNVSSSSSSGTESVVEKKISVLPNVSSLWEETEDNKNNISKFAVIKNTSNGVLAGSPDSSKKDSAAVRNNSFQFVKKSNSATQIVTSSTGSNKKESAVGKNNSFESVIDKKSAKKETTNNKAVGKSSESSTVVKSEGAKKKTDRRSELGADSESHCGSLLTTSVEKEDQTVVKVCGLNKVPYSDESSTPKLSDTEDSEERKKRMARKRALRNRSATRSEGGSEGDSPINGPKRSARRWSKEGESVLQNAIARKEKSLSSIGKSDDDKSLKSALVRSLRENRNSLTGGKRSQNKSQDSVSLNSECSTDSKSKSPKLSLTENANDVSMESRELKGDVEVESTDSAGTKTSRQESESPSYTKTGKRRYKPFRGLRYSFSGVTKRTKVFKRSSPPQKANPKDHCLKKVSPTSNMSSKSGSTIQKGLNGAAVNKSRSNSPAVADACTSKNKKSRRENLQSPSPSPGDTPSDANQPESTAISFGAGTAGLCLCQSKTNLYVRKEPSVESDVSLMCQAIDSLEGRLIGCCNAVGGSESARLYRPSPRVPYVVVCEQHRQRLLRHHCCPGCGHYCTQGRFVQCPALHYYHRDCQLLISGKPQCPHCGLDSPPDEVSISLGVRKYPVFLPHQKLVNQTPSARMTLGSNTPTAEQPESPPVSIAMTLPIATTVLDKGEREKLEKFMNGACSMRSEGRSAHMPRYSTKHLYQAAKAGDSEKIIGIIRHGINPNHIFRDANMRTALHAAAEKGHVLAVHVLVQAGAQLDPQDNELMTPVMYACLNNHIRIVQYLVKAGACVTHQGSDGMTALHIAAKQGHLDICHSLLTNGKAPLGYIDVKDDGGWTALVWSCEFRHATVARYLLENRADPLLRDTEQNIALHWAAFSGSEEISEKLLNYGCDVNCLNIHGDSPLHVAARQDNLDCVLLFLSRGGRPDLVNKLGQQPLDCAVEGGDCYNSINTTSELRKMTKSAKERTTKILTNDITRGKEESEIQCLNAVDEEAEPRDYVYVTENCFTSNIHVDRTITSLQSCECEDACVGTSCKCTQLSLQSWYDSEGKLLPEFNFFDPPMLFECNEMCSCNVKLCRNRVVQRGLKVRFQLFRTDGKGWGVRTLTPIPKGTYVCEYVGEIISDCEADQREDDSYLFDLDNRDGETYCIDACRYGNIARFINHMCAPNLQPVRVFMGHHDLHFPRIAFFANRDILPQEELGFDYGDKFWIIKYKSFTCTCGAASCKYSENTIKQTLMEYNRKQEEETAS